MHASIHPSSSHRYEPLSESTLSAFEAGVAVRPKNAAEVSAVLKVCNTHRIPVITHGGRTGLAGAAISQPGEVILLTDRLEGGIEIDADLVDNDGDEHAAEGARAEGGLLITDIMQHAAGELERAIHALGGRL